jgi:ubiquinone/menaquinone biosynthesis C-methylase UbiE
VNWLRRFLSPSAPQLTPELRGRIRASFDEAARDEQHFPSVIDPRIYHVKLLLDHLGNLEGKRVLDAGCGKGRFARIVKERYPGAEVWGLDISSEMLRFVPQDIAKTAGTLTELPFSDGAFDAVYATESLEHAVEIERAVAEICRVARPGGRILIIDKNAAQCGRLKTPDWERWFGRKELETLLGKHCREATSREISYWEDVKPDGLFLAWLAVK